MRFYAGVVSIRYIFFSLILIFFIISANNAIAEQPSPDSPSGKSWSKENSNENDKPKTSSDSSNPSSGGNVLRGEMTGTIQSELSVTNNLANSHEYKKREPINLTIQLKSLDDKNRIESVTFVGELPPEIEFLSADQTGKFDKNSRKISWILTKLYKQKIDLKFSVYLKESGNFQIPVSVHADMRLKDGNQIYGFKDVNPISLNSYNFAPEVIQVNSPESIILPVINERSVSAVIRDIDNDNVKCNLIDNSLSIIKPTRYLNDDNNNCEYYTWDLPYFWWGTYSYVIKADDSGEEEFTKQGDYANERTFNVVYGFSNLVFLLALCSIGPLILAFIHYKSYVFNKKEKTRSILSREMDIVIEPLYKIFKENDEIINYMSLPIEERFHVNNHDLKKNEREIKEIFEKQELNVDSNLLLLYENYKKFYKKNDFQEAKQMITSVAEYVSERYKNLKYDLYEK